MGDIPKSPEKPLLKPDSKSKSESEPKLSKHPKNLDEFAKNDHNKTKRDLETPNNKISTDKNTDHKPTSVPTLNQEDDKTKKDNLVVETKPETEDKSINERIHPNKAQEEIIPKLKKTKNAEITESPLEKLRRLENEKPTEVESVEEELVISELPSYDLPTQRQKTALQRYENLGKDSFPKQKLAMEEYPDEWEKLQKKPNESDDTINPIILGKGIKTDDDIGHDLKLKILENDNATEPEKSPTLDPFDMLKFQESLLPKPDSKSKSESETKPLKYPIELDEFARSDHDKTLNNKICTDRSTDHESISAKSLNREDAKTIKDNLLVELKPETEDKIKNERILPNKTEEEIKPKLKKTNNAEITESPLEKLKRLEIAKPTEVEFVEEEIVISELPSYDLPTQRQKTVLEHYENQRKDSITRQKEAMEEYPDEWEKLKKKHDESDDTNNPIILGKEKHSDIDIGDDLMLKILQNDKPTEQEKSLTLKPFDVPELQETPLPKQDSKSKSKSEKAELAKNNHDRTKREVPNVINTDHEPISALTLAREGAETKKDNSVVETKPAKPVEDSESIVEEAEKSELPSYDLPTKREKTILESHE